MYIWSWERKHVSQLRVWRYITTCSYSKMRCVHNENKQFHSCGFLFVWANMYCYFHPVDSSLLPANICGFLNSICTQRRGGISVCVYLVGSKWVAVSWHRATVDGNCVPDATLQVVAAEKNNRTLHFSAYENAHRTKHFYYLHTKNTAHI